MSPFGRWSSLTIAAVLVVSGATAPAGAAESAPEEQTVELPAVIEDDLSAAVGLAKTTGEPVAVSALTSPTERTLALPDGTLQYEVSNTPVRVPQDGEWVPVDTRLESAEGWLVPGATVAPVRFADGGTDVLAQVQTASGEWITERWPHGTLPAPTVDGPTATYREVLPGVDLRLTATEIGMTTVYVVKNERAAKTDELRSLGVEIAGATLSRSGNGGVREGSGRC